jgi:hypothetical protein
MEEPYNGFIILVKLGLLCNKGNKAAHVPKCNEDGLLLKCTFGIIVWYHFLE